MTQPLKIGIAGLGTVGAGVVKLLAEHNRLLALRGGRPLKIVAVSARSKAKKRDIDLGKIRWERDPLALATAPDIDVVVELIGGSDGIARRLVQTALRQGKHVVTANKALLAHHGAELAALAEKKECILGFEAAVAGGIPIIKALREGLVGNRVRRLYGILNGTCNYILTTMRETGRDFGAVLAEAQAAGYAEADPSFDVDGVDAAHKLAVLTGAAFGAKVNFEGIHVEGIRRVTAMDIEFGEELGYRIKLLGLARETRYGIEQRVHPCMVPLKAPIAHIEGVFNAVVVEGDFVGTTMFQGRGAGQGPTASAVVADLVDVARGRSMPAFVVPAERLADIKVSPMARHFGAYYMRLMVQDRPGVIAAVSGILAKERISVEGMLQRGRSQSGEVPVVITTHETEEAAMQRAVARIAKLKAVAEEPCIIRIEQLLRTVEETMAAEAKMDRNLALEAVRVTEAAALAASKLMGRGDEKMADQAAVDAMRTSLNALSIDGTVVIGEGERDEAPMLYIGEKVGTGGPKIDIALDPLEGTTITAKGLPNALAVMAMAEDGGFLNAPDVYMDKIAVGAGLPDGVVDLDKTPAQNLADLAKAKKIEVPDLVVCILDRPRHSELIAKVREAGARIVLIGDGDVSGVIATSTGDSGIDIYMGSGGAPEGVLAAAALRCIGGQIQGRLLFRNDDERGRAKKWGITDLNRKYSMIEMAKGDVMFAATGVTNGSMLKGVRRFHNGAETHSIIMRSKTGTVRWISAHHNFSIKTGLPSWA